MKKIFINTIVAIANLKDIIASVFEPGGEPVKIRPFDRKLKTLGEKWLVKLKHALPGTKISFVGSAALELPGNRDLDFIVECGSKTLKNNVVKLSDILGKPNRHDDGEAEWKISDHGVSVEVLIIDNKSRKYHSLMDIFTGLSKNPEMLERYKQIKLASNGLKFKQYELNRKFLFNELFYRYGHGLDFIFKQK